MHAQVTFLSSCHSERGLCNSFELYKIIDFINPDIIFEELDIESFNDHYGQNGPYSTETMAIFQYIRNKNIKHIPVDTYDMKYFAKEDKEYMDNIICNSSNEYRKLLEEQLRLIHFNGFKFLNSDECIKILCKIQSIENYIQEQSNDNKLKNIYKNWIALNNKRENEMIRNIYEYFKENKFNRGLLITGADHRKTLIEKIKKINNEEIKIEWNYWQK